MKLTNRDVEIINFIEENKGATIEQLQRLFFPSYDMASKRLRKLSYNNFLKVRIHPILGKKVYYLQKMPSYHSLVINDFTILYKDRIKFMQREYTIKNHKVDCLFILKTKKIIILEVDIYNQTKEEKIKSVMDILKQTNAKTDFIIICKQKRRKKCSLAKYIGIDEIKTLSNNKYYSIS